MDNNILNKIEYPNEGILSKDLINEDGLNASLFIMAKNSNISNHTSTKKGTVYVLEGKGTFNLEGKDIEMVPGVLIYMKKNAVHSLKSEENTCFILTLTD
jgi:nitric oxide dioxygenase|tara:strand:- start:54 stop:353 length:300 start_codon:yes stop_codon:yes gene_type:complete